MLEYWYLLPICMVGATVAMSAGVSGSNFWIPLYLLWLGVEPRVAFWAGLVTMLFGFASGVMRNLRAGTVDRHLVTDSAKFLLPATAVGALGSTWLPTTFLLAALALFDLALALLLARASTGSGRPAPIVKIGPASLVAGGLQGAIATGGGAVLMPALLADQRTVKPADAVGSTIVLLFMASLLSAALRIDQTLWSALVENRGDIGRMLLFAAPGVILGGQLGPRLAGRLPAHLLQRYVACVLVVISGLISWRLFSG